MNLREHLRVHPANLVLLTVPGHPDLERVIEMPVRGSVAWLAEAYLLSLGIESEPARRTSPDEASLHGVPSSDWTYDPRLGHDRVVTAASSWSFHADWRDEGIWREPFGSEPPEPQFEPLGPDFEPQWPDGSSWRRAEPRMLEMPGLPAPAHVFIGGTRLPEIGESLVSVVRGTVDEASDRHDDWLIDPPRFRGDLINEELVRSFGVVLPRFDESSIGQSVSSTPLGALLGALSPVRRIALKVHLESTGVLQQPTRSLDIVESAVSSMRVLVADIGADGLGQDETTGWVSPSDLEMIAADLGWSPTDTIPEPARELLDFARRSRLVRRFKGRVIVTKAGRDLVAPSQRTLTELARLLMEPRDPYRAYVRPSASTLLAVLALADGSAASFAELPDLVERGAVAMNRPREPDDMYDDYGLWRAESVSDARPGESAADALAVTKAFCMLAEPGRFGEITPAMRAVAKAALR